jgi:hypothetical protein
MTDREPPSGLWNLQSLVAGTPPPGPQPPGPPRGPQPPGPPPPGPQPPDPATPAPQESPPAVWTSPPPPMAGPPSGSGAGGRRRLMIVLGGAAVLLVAAGVTTVGVNAATRDTPSPPPVAEYPVGPAPTTQPEYTPEQVAPDETETVPEETADPEQAALDALDAQHDQDLPTVSLHGQYAAQLASKNPGINDPYQTTEAGSHVFQAADILREHQALRAGTTDGTPVVLLKSTDYGKRQRYHGAALWVTFALGDFADGAAVLDWCAGRFPKMSHDERANQCAARKLEPGR